MLNFNLKSPRSTICIIACEQYFSLLDPFFLDPIKMKDVPVASLCLKFADPGNFLPLENIDLGPYMKLHFSRIVGKISPATVKMVQTNCLNFYVILMTQMNIRFPFNSVEIQMPEDLECLDPANLKRKTNISLVAAALDLDVADVYLIDSDVEVSFQE